VKIKTLFATQIIVIIVTLFSTMHVYGEHTDNIYIRINLWTNELIVIKNNEVIKRYSIASGTEEFPTPIGTFEVKEKAKSWGGGFGTRWLGLNVTWGMYGIHGTNKPSLIGKNVSGGCIRMRNEDVESLFEMIPKGTIVYIEGPVTGKGKGEFKSLSLGSKGNLVQLIQQRLKAMGLYNGTVDGIYDINTERVVKKFQKLNNLPITGVVTVREYRLLGLLE
jgi:L,D-transpeptidase catalytic domain/Putative peptidoglycan binding domain